MIGVLPRFKTLGASRGWDLNALMLHANQLKKLASFCIASVASHSVLS